MTKINMVDILLVEDNLGDIRLTEEALKDFKIKVNLHVVMDGEEAIEFLYKRGKYKDTPVPDLILLDLNLPKKDGRQVLKEIKEDEQLKIIPVVVLTISEADRDITLTYGLHANCYITKPLDFSKFLEVIKQLENFWFTIVKLPVKKEHDK